MAAYSGYRIGWIVAKTGVGGLGVRRFQGELVVFLEIERPLLDARWRPCAGRAPFFSAHLVIRDGRFGVLGGFASQAVREKRLCPLHSIVRRIRKLETAVARLIGAVHPRSHDQAAARPPGVAALLAPLIEGRHHAIAVAGPPTGDA